MNNTIINSNWVKCMVDNKTSWKRFIKKNDDIITEYSNIEPLVPDNQLDIMKQNTKKHGKVIYTKWKLVGENVWKRLIKYPWNEVDVEMTDTIPTEHQSELVLNDPLIQSITIDNYTILENSIETPITPIHTSSWIERTDNKKHWVKYTNDNNNSIRIKTDNPPDEIEENEIEEIQDNNQKELSIKNGSVKYSNWSSRVDSTGKYQRRFIIWPWGETEREIKR